MKNRLAASALAGLAFLASAGIARSQESVTITSTQGNAFMVSVIDGRGLRRPVGILNPRSSITVKLETGERFLIEDRFGCTIEAPVNTKNDTQARWSVTMNNSVCTLTRE